MSKYTTEVRYICENAAGLTESAGFNSIDSILTEAAPVVFNFDFPIWDETYRLTLEKKILRHYYTREISAETVGLWKLWLEDRLNIIMPYYNKLYETTVYEFNPLYNVDYRTSGSGASNGSGYEEVSNTESEQVDNQTSRNGSAYNERENVNSTSGTRNATNEESNSNISSGSRTENDKDWNLYSDTPQGGIDGIDDTTNIYLTNATKVTRDNNASENGSTCAESQGKNDQNWSENTSDNEARSNIYSESGAGSQNRSGSSSRSGSNIVSNTNEYIDHVIGKIGGGSYASLIAEFRNTLLNIDEMIIEELSDLFFTLW